MPTDWTNAALFEQLTCLLWSLSKDQFTKEIKDEIVEKLAKIEPDITWNGMRQHIQKLQKKEGNTVTTPVDTPKKTPAKRKTGSAKKKQASQPDGDDSDDYEGTPAKKAKMTPKRPEPSNAELPEVVSGSPSVTEEV